MKWLIRINQVLVVTIVCLLGYAGVSMILGGWHQEKTVMRRKAGELRKGSFHQEEEAYASVKETLLKVPFHPPRIELPDLRDEIKFLGGNGRPDAVPEQMALHFSCGKEATTLSAGKQCYLLFDGQSYVPSKEPTNLWVIPEVIDAREVALSVAMKDQTGTIVSTPEENGRVVMQASEKLVGPREGWMLDTHRVDNSLLARQRARWYGEDLFLTNHGGEEFSYAIGKQRLEFGDETSTYACYVNEGESLIWKEGQWQTLMPGESSEGYPILWAKKVDDKLLMFDLWDVDGKGKLSLSLMRAKTMWLPNHLKQDLQFTGVRTWSQFVVTAGQHRLNVGPGEWLLVSERGWERLTTIDQIDRYVSGELQGELFVIEGIERKDGKQVLKGRLYNQTRSEVEDIFLPLAADPMAGPAKMPGGPITAHVPEEAMIPPTPVEVPKIEEEESLLRLPKVVRNKAKKK